MSQNAQTSRPTTADPAAENEEGRESEAGHEGTTSATLPEGSNQRQPTEPTSLAGLTDAQTTRRRHLESLDDDFRDGNRTRAEAYAAILAELDRGPELTRENKETTFQLYSTEIDSAETRAHRRLAVAGAATAANAPQQDQLTSGRSDVGSGPDDEPGDEEPRKRRKLHESDMPWHRGDNRDAHGTDPSCTKTVELLRVFNDDIKKCKFYISIAPGAPDNIPTSQWEHIFKGETVDLDQVLSSLHRVTIAEERKARVGETDIALGPTEATRKVSTSSDWSAAWRRAARGIAFAFPHRQQELEDYAEYIENEFAAKNSSGHHRIIQYDIAIRNLVRGGQQIRLTDYYRFTSLYSAIVLPDGVQYSGGQRPQARKKAEICNRFNEKGCSAPNCRYRHVCKM